jgi:hypothetical protein
VRIPTLPAKAEGVVPGIRVQNVVAEATSYKKNKFFILDYFYLVEMIKNNIILHMVINGIENFVLIATILFKNTRHFT